MRIIYAKDYDQMSRRAAGILAAQLTLKPNSVLGLATGDTPLGAYRQLIAWGQTGDVNFARAQSVNLDEYVGIEAGDVNSYAHFMKANLFDHINIKPENTHIPNGLAQDPAAECARYEQTIRALGGIDLQLLGIGHNGHIGFNEPGGAFEGETHCVTLTHSTREANARFFSSLEEVPMQAYTMGIKSIMNSKKILLVASGAGKAEIVDRMVTGKIEPGVPASILQLHGDVTLVADAAALAALLGHAPNLVEERP